MSAAITDQPLTSLGFSEGFLMASKKMGYVTLQDIIAEQPENLIKKNGYTHHWLSELSRFLVKNDALHLLQKFKGNNHA